MALIEEDRRAMTIAHNTPKCALFTQKSQHSFSHLTQEQRLNITRCMLFQRTSNAQNKAIAAVKAVFPPQSLHRMFCVCSA